MGQQQALDWDEAHPHGVYPQAQYLQRHRSKNGMSTFIPENDGHYELFRH